MPTVVLQNWEESERGWGVRPDGLSLHLSNADRDAYVKEYWDRMPNSAPDEYSRPSGQPRVVDVTQQLYDEIRVVPKGVRYFRTPEGLQ